MMIDAATILSCFYSAHSISPSLFLLIIVQVYFTNCLSGRKLVLVLAVYLHYFLYQKQAQSQLILLKFDLWFSQNLAGLLMTFYALKHTWFVFSSLLRVMLSYLNRLNLLLRSLKSLSSCQFQPAPLTIAILLL